MSNSHRYDPYQRPVGSYDQTMIPTSVVHRTIGINGISRLGGVPTPDEINVEWLRERLAEMTAPDYTVNRMFFEGNHWQDAEQWSGPAPNPRERDAGLALAAIQRSFVSRNCIKETVTRQGNGVLSREPAWYLTNQAPRGSDEPLSAEEETLRKSGEALLTDWWDRVNAAEIMVDCVQKALLGKRAALRLFIPPGLLTADGKVPVKRGDFETALRFIEIEALEPLEGGVITDRASKQQYGAYLFVDANQVERAELCYVEHITQSLTGAAAGNGGTTFDPNQEAETIIRLLEPSNENANTLSTASDDERSRTFREVIAAPQGTELVPDRTVREVRLQIGGRLTIFELGTEQLITEQVRALQRAINKALTMGDHNIEVAGFVERTIFNGQMPGHYEPDPDRPGRKKFVRDEYTTGGGAINFINGIPVYDDQGQLKGVATPSMDVRQPTLPEAFEKTERWYYAALLDECHQAHYLLAGSEYVSGESRIQSRAEYVEALRKVKKAVDAAGRWLLETLLALAGWLAQEPLTYEPMRASFSCRLVPGPATAESVRSAIELRAAGGLSREGMMERTDIEDVDAEVRRINNEEEQGVVPPGRASGRPGEGLATVEASSNGNGARPPGLASGDVTL